MPSINHLFIEAMSNKDYGHHASVGAYFAGKRTHKQYLRQNNLGKFRKGK
jgi:hypothetical protein